MIKLSTLAFVVLSVHEAWADQHGHLYHLHKPRAPAGAVADGPQVADVVVYVNENNEAVSTATIYQETSSTSIPLASSSSIASRPFHASMTDEGPTLPSESAQAASGIGSGASQGSFTVGVTYSPYNADHSCKSAAEVASDLATTKDFQVIRLYGTDCNQVANVAKALDSKTSIFAGVYDLNDIESETELIHSGVNGDWQKILAVSVGNELVNSGQASVGQVTSAIAAARSALKAKGYTGPVTTVDTMIAMQNHPELCQASDFCAINCHAFFDGHVEPANAGAFVSGWVQKVSAAAGGKRVVITESGWPTQGTANGQAQPGQAQQQTAVESLKSSLSKDLILFTLYNDLWKQDSASTFNAEKYWGLRG